MVAANESLSCSPVPGSMLPAFTPVMPTYVSRKRNAEDHDREDDDGGDPLHG